MSHSEIHGSRVICTYPWLIAAYHVLHRLREPRHPPDALTCFRHKIEYVASASTLPAAKTIQKDTLPAANYSLFAHTFSCKLRVVKKHSVNKLKVFTYSLVCQYVKDLVPIYNFTIYNLQLICPLNHCNCHIDPGKWRITDSNR